MRYVQDFIIVIIIIIIIIIMIIKKAVYQILSMCVCVAIGL